ncbi:hypothetical protein COV17_00575 [Candidatus Woesearchaeota archaeon CG10_big_fil_rev_8_21_14_0_10_36_11]|nr:MAG: hypothetical protein COV17_00575 [Candidatus Woesearchaeota archaeon CG10_big_fil_rev_8_21_14_0_10_36_11]
MAKIKTTVIGSYPKYPRIIGENFDTKWLVSPGENLDKGWKSKENLEELQQEAIRWAVKEQEKAGIDILTDGEQRRGNFVLYHCQHLEGFDFVNKEEKKLRGGSRTELVPTIKGFVKNKEPFLVKEFEFLKKLTKKEIKITIPGPLTIIDSSKDLFYDDEKKLALDVARAIREEVKSLAEAGCKIIQFDEPAFIREPQKFFNYGIDALEECFRGVEGITTIVHICRGYPSKEKDVKAEKENYAQVVEALSKTNINQIAIEDAHEHLNLDFFKKFGSKTVILGSVEIGGVKVESVDEIQKRIKEILTIISPEQLQVSPDCGLLLLSPEIAKAKLTNLVLAAKKVSDSV